VLAVLAVPLFSMRLAFSDAGNDPPSLTTRQAYDLLAEGFGPGFNGPLVVTADLRGPHAQAGIAQLDLRLSRVPGVASVIPPVVNAAGDAAVIVVYPATAPQSAQTAALVGRLRDQVIPQVTPGSGITAFVGGETAAGADTSAYLSSRLPWVIGLVVLLAFFLLLFVFRSIAIPLKAAAMNLLSMGAAYGVIVAVYQWGWFAGVFGVGGAGPIDPWIPLMMFTIVFGLSMDYEVFLLSRMREEWLRSGDNTKAVATGLASTARVITAAAAIMVCVFGLGLAVAVFVDATVVRMVLVPAVMQLLGSANWWLPGARRLNDRRDPSHSKPNCVFSRTIRAFPVPSLTRRPCRRQKGRSSAQASSRSLSPAMKARFRSGWPVNCWFCSRTRSLTQERSWPRPKSMTQLRGWLRRGCLPRVRREGSWSRGSLSGRRGATGVARSGNGHRETARLARSAATSRAKCRWRACPGGGAGTSRPA
jgi:hypothetical protein